jgi:hypothetical protein
MSAQKRLAACFEWLQAANEYSPLQCRLLCIDSMPHLFILFGMWLGS